MKPSYLETSNCQRSGFGFQEGRIYAEDNGLLFYETSARTAQNVNELFSEIGKKIESQFVKSLALYCGSVNACRDKASERAAVKDKRDDVASPQARRATDECFPVLLHVNKANECISLPRSICIYLSLPLMDVLQSCLM